MLVTRCQLRGVSGLNIYLLYPHYGGTLCQIFFGYSDFGLYQPNGVSMDGYSFCVVSLLHYVRHDKEDKG